LWPQHRKHDILRHRKTKREKFFEKLRENPEAFLRLLRDHLGIKLKLEGDWGKWDIEEQILLSTFDTPDITEVYVRSGNATGKSLTAGAIGNAWLFCRQPSKVVYLSTKKEQAKAQAWSEFLGIYSRIYNWCRRNGIFVPEPMVERIDFRYDWWARVYAGQVRGEKSRSIGWSGFHAPYAIFIIDEAPGLPNNVYEMVTGNITGRHNLVLAQGNPLSRGSDGYDWWYLGQQEPVPSHRKVFVISAKSSPNYLSGEELIPGLASREWVERIEADPRTRPGTPYHDAHIRGEFPTGTEWGLIPWGDIQKAADKSHAWQECIENLGYESWREIMSDLGRDEAIRLIEAQEADVLLPDFNRLAIGVDVADAGGNLSIITVLAGDKVLEQRVVDGKASVAVPPAVEETLRDYETWTVGIDKPGVGAGPAALLIERGIEVLEYKGGIPVEDSDERQEYADLNAEMAWRLRQKFIDGEIEIPDDNALKQQLASIQWQYTAGSKVKVPKPRKSPDRFDSLRIALWVQQFGDYSIDITSDQLPRYSGQFGSLEDW